MDAPTAAAALAPAAPAAAPAAAAPAAPTPAAAAPAAAPAEPAAASPAPVIPGKDATPAEWSAFFKGIGAPASAEAYNLPVPEGGDKAFSTEAAGIMAEVGLLPHQAQKLAEWWNGKSAAMTQSQQAAQEAAAVAANEAAKRDDAALRNEWGATYDANINAGKAAVAQFLPKDKAADLITAMEGVVGYGQVMRFMAQIGKGLGSGTANGLGGAPGEQPKTLAQALYPNMAP